MNHRYLQAFIVLPMIWVFFSGTGLGQGDLPDKRYREINHLLGEQKHEQCIAEFQSLIHQHPDYYYAYSKLIQVSNEIGQLERTRAWLESLLPNPPSPMTYAGIGRIHHLKQDYQMAITNYQLCLSGIPNSDFVILRLVECYRMLKKNDEAETFLRSLINSDSNNAAAIHGLGYLFLLSGKNPDAIRQFDLANKINSRNAILQYNRANLFTTTGNAVLALSALKDCLGALAGKPEIEIEKAISLLGGTIHRRLGNFTEALISLNLAIQLAKETADFSTEESSLSRKGSLYLDQNHYALAISSYQKALEASRKIKRGAYPQRILGNIGEAYFELGEWTLAQKFYEESLRESIAAKDEVNQASVLKNLGNLFLKQNNFEQALATYEQALALARQNKNLFVELETLNMLSLVNQQRGDYRQALDAVNQALELVSPMKNPVRESESLVTRGSFHLRFNELAQAEKSYLEALSIGRNRTSPSVIWQAHKGLGTVYEALGQPDEASKRYKEAIEVIEQIRAQFGGEEDKIGYFQDKVAIYRKMISLQLKVMKSEKTSLAPSVENGDEAEAFYYSELARSRAFRDLLAASKINIEQNLAPDLAARKKQIENTASRINSELMKEYSAMPEKQDNANIERLEKARSKVNEDFSDWERELWGREPRYKLLDTIKLPEAQKLLDERSAMLAFSLGEEESFLFAVTSNDYKVFRLKPAAEIRRRVDDLLGVIHGKGRANSPIGTFKTSARELYQSLIEPAKEMLAGKSELIVIPDESLHRLPFETLLTAQPDGKWEQLPYLVRDFAISYAPSVSVLAFLKTQPQRVTPKDFIAFGDPVFGKDDQMNNQAKMLASTISKDRGLSVKPERLGFWRKLFGSPTRGASTGPLKFDRLPFSRDEAIEIAKLFSTGKADVFLDKDATEEKAKTKDLLGQYGIVHFSTHGLPNEDRPRFSSLIMSSPAKGKTASETIEDGWLSAYEIFNLKLNANLVVLSACETGLGKEVKGEGLMSLTRAFMFAGAPSVVVSLWKVNDSASKDLMVTFYRGLRDGEKLSYSEALRRAQLEMIAKGNAPKLWAPFVLIGRP